MIDKDSKSKGTYIDDREASSVGIAEQINSMRSYACSGIDLEPPYCINMSTELRTEDIDTVQYIVFDIETKFQTYTKLTEVQSSLNFK